MVEEAKLAWVLAQLAGPHLNAVERNDIYVTIGVGETFSAISSLITTVVGKQLTVPADLVNRLSTWLDGYVGNDGGLYRRALRMTRHRADPEDLLQDIMLRAYAGFPTFCNGTTLNPWLHRSLPTPISTATAERSCNPCSS